MREQPLHRRLGVWITTAALVSLGCSALASEGTLLRGLPAPGCDPGAEICPPTQRFSVPADGHLTLRAGRILHAPGYRRCDYVGHTTARRRGRVIEVTVTPPPPDQGEGHGLCRRLPILHGWVAVDGVTAGVWEVVVTGADLEGVWFSAD